MFSIKGSPSGAFGIPQFLPSSFLDFAVDGNQDGIRSLYQHPDAILSVGNFLRHYLEEAKANEALEETSQNTSAGTIDISKAIWKYNNSEPYVNTVIDVARKLGLKSRAHS